MYLENSHSARIALTFGKVEHILGAAAATFHKQSPPSVVGEQPESFPYLCMV